MKKGVRTIFMKRPSGCSAEKSSDPFLRRRGLSLLEVLLALAILAFALTALGQLVAVGSRSSASARGLTQAQLLCQSKLAEIQAGITLPDPVDRAPILDEPDWVYSIALEATEIEELVSLRVTVEPAEPGRVPLAFTLSTWIPDPGLELPEATLPEPAEEETADE